ncbi:Sodium/hydrogen exchanger family-domain-containing protein [Radiomyces spectabilis]|uniref:Sodium/hydrogen exchanger family-domain-containing protein n=1 Tax=Radiomyces spectabilis TaxID=64574 RepID=UPI0022202C06|nr:Sodium/hydrogen exchanger family-domain-containing protein [Radiomyces spectabilis]KAI8365278.1 Sodium/hydrogen exchanger family-domain-containing protein [Radiomyces spectabilis]
METGAAPQAGVFSGLNPAQFNANNPIVLFIIQATIILIFCRALAVPLAWLRQPRVISEVLAGIILGPSVMGRIPGFKDAIFPDPSLPFLNLISTLGLVFFLFQVGLEVDLDIVRRDWRKSVLVAIAGMALPFGLGIAVSVGLYKLQGDPSVPFSSFLLFLGVAMAITAFPVLARILAELKLLRTQVGAITMAAGILNDCTAWILLALVVALLNATGGLEALWVFLTTVGFALFLIFGVAPLYKRLCVYTQSFEHGPSPLLMTVTLLTVLVSAFVTDIIGVHAIFGGFLAGVIVPHKGDLAIKITEKIEDIVNIIFLPLYFTLSGLKTQIGLLDDGTVWGYVVLVIFVACFGKIVGCTLAAKGLGMTLRESFAVGFLMNCKGLVELIVLNIGHDAGVLNDQIFVIMVVMALVTTFMTTPMVLWLYPPSYQKRVATETQEGLVEGYPKEPSIQPLSGKTIPDDRYCLVTMLNRIDAIPSMMALIRLLKQESLNGGSSEKKKPKRHIEIHALRLLELTQRASAVMKIKDSRETTRQDPVLNVLRTFASLIGLESLQTRLDFCPLSEYVQTVAHHGEEVQADLILLPWISSRYLQWDASSHPLEQHYLAGEWSSYPTSDVDFATQTFAIRHCTVGLFIDRGFGHIQDGDPRLTSASAFQVIIPYLGGPDDNAALLFALRLHMNRHVDVLILRYTHNNASPARAAVSHAGIVALLDSDAASETDPFALLLEEQGARSVNVTFQQVQIPLQGNCDMFASLPRPLGRHDLVILGRQVTQVNDLSRQLSVTNHPADTDPSNGSSYNRDVRAALGTLTHDILSMGVQASIVVIQAADPTARSTISPPVSP